MYSKFIGPSQIVFNITNRCNLNCIHCFNNSKKKKNDDLHDDEVLHLVDQICEIKPYNICFSGGEPLLRKELLIYSSKMLSEKGIRVCLLTNGVLLNGGTIDELLAAGVTEISISIDGSSQEIHEKLRLNKNSFNGALEALKLLKLKKFPLYEASYTITPFNYFDIGNTIILLESIGCRILSLRPLIIYGRAINMKKTLTLPNIIYRYIRSNIFRYRKNDGKLDILFTDPISHVFCYLKDKNPFIGMEIKANGSLIISPYIQLSFGDIRKYPLKKYWQAGWENIWHSLLIRNILKGVTTFTDFEIVQQRINQIGRIDLVESSI
jgi:MoaA/NifB/PqqE/SkfB family radical SAM enzyme